MKVLIIDDDLRNIFALSAVLRTKQLNCLSAISVAEGLLLLDGNKDIFLVLIDIMMPETDGFEALEKIRQNHKTRSLPVVAVTAKAMDGDRKKCLEAGFNDYISKPVDIGKLMSVISKYIHSQPISRAK